ncbi:MAG TPA: VWA domain-containing protein [Planctomycetaceae bacterium]|jgi:Ca-activated chloride channel family protein|nr:VWA domain-containing protein [Planctomycetaceae bacterium]
MASQPAATAPQYQKKAWEQPAAPVATATPVVTAPSVAPDAARPFNTETYDVHHENAFLSARQNPLSTFSIDVDTAAYSLVRRFLHEGRLPPTGAVRIEELVNYFSYDYAEPKGTVPFSVNVELANCPWNPQHRLARIGLLGRRVHPKERPASNLVFLLDVSGSMSDQNKLPLVKSAMKMLVDRLDKDDRVAIVTYAGASGVALPSTSALDRAAIVDAVDALSANGSTNGGEGIRLAYKVATENFIRGGVNRIILCTDGDFNVGVTDQSELIRLVENEARSGVALTVLGFGMGNYKDSTMEKLADKGNGNYAYIDTAAEAHKVLVEQLSGTLVTIAKDVKIQVDFNPARAAGYRLLGYENRLLRHEDFKNDAKDAGEIGAGHTVTAFYEVIPAGQPIPGADVDPTKYQGAATLTDAAAGRELFTIRLRYKDPDGQTSKPFEVPVVDESKPFPAASKDYQFAASVAQFGLLLADSPYRGNSDFSHVLEIASSTLGPDHGGHRAEFLELVKTARRLKQPDSDRAADELQSDARPVPLVQPVPRPWTHMPPPAPQIAAAPFEIWSTTDAVLEYLSELPVRLLIVFALVCLLVAVEKSRHRRAIMEFERHRSQCR